jgi:hypothetical protein
MFKKLEIHLNEWNVILIYYVIGFQNIKNYNYFKNFFKNLKIVIFKYIFLSYFLYVL